MITQHKYPFYVIISKGIRVAGEVCWAYLVCLIFSTTSVWNIFHSDKYLASYKATTFEMITETRVGLRLVSVVIRLCAKLRMHQQISVKLHENPFTRFRVAACERMDIHTQRS